jgi:hypothetical protein
MQKQLISLEQWDKNIAALFEEDPTYPRPNGIACPKCGKELNDLDGEVYLMVPPKRNVGCECGFIGHRIA